MQKKSTRDEIYQKFLTIIYNWCEKRNSQYGVALNHIVKEQYGPEEFYAFKIGCSNFAEAYNYNPEIDSKLDEHDKRIIKFACCGETLTLDMLSELNEELKAAGAKTVYLHPYRWIDSNGFEHETVTNQQLILIQV